jgi:hypothetical protein
MSEESVKSCWCACGRLKTQGDKCDGCVVAAKQAHKDACIAYVATLPPCDWNHVHKLPTEEFRKFITARHKKELIHVR